ncbi:MAG: dolichyl-phosphate-mannose--protein mannosyltransferase [Bacteroidaceae bacterium]
MKKNTFIYAIILLLLLPVLLLRDFTPSNELRYLSIVDEAMRNGNFFSFFNHGIPYADKPPLYFWLVMLGKWLFGYHCMMYLSLLSLLPAFVTVHVMDKWIAGEATPQSRFTGILMMMSCGLFLGLSIFLRMDILMCMFIVLALYTFYRLFKQIGNKKIDSILFPLYLFGALFSKGPLGLLIPLFSIIAFLVVEKQIKTFFRYFNWKTLLILLTGCFIWFTAVYMESGTAYLYNLVFHQTVNRAVNSFHHVHSFYYYMISVWYSLAPWSLLIIGVIAIGAYKRMLSSDIERFFLVVALCSFVVLSCISSKLEVYLIPAFPFAVYLCILLLPRFKRGRSFSLLLAIPEIVLLLALPGVLVLIHFPNMEYLGNPFIIAASVLLTVSSATSLFFLYKKQDLYKSIQILAIGLGITIFVGGWSLPSINSELGYAVICKKAQEITIPQAQLKYYACGLSHPENMDVFLKKDVKELSAEEVVSGAHTGILFLDRDEIKKNPILHSFMADKKTYDMGKYLVLVF